MSTKPYRFKPAIILLIMVLPILLSAQQKIKVEQLAAHKILNLQFHYTLESPGGDLASRFGLIHNIGFGGLLKTQKNWMLGLDASFQFGGDVKETNQILFNLTNSSSVISTNSGSPSTISLSERGFNTFIKGGKLFILSKANRNSGIVVMAGAGFLSHKININTAQSNVPTLTEDLKKGYDRLSMGFAITQFAGYHFQSRHRMVNFFIGMDVIEAFTKSTRGYNYDQMAYDHKNRTDIFLGFRFGWMIPIYLTTKDQEEFYYK